MLFMKVKVAALVLAVVGLAISGGLLTTDFRVCPNRNPLPL
jgi:hypothetical protein